MRKLFENYGKIVDWDIKLSKNGQTNCVTVTFEKKYNYTNTVTLPKYCFPTISPTVN